jgi:hypothetical protein
MTDDSHDDISLEFDSELPPLVPSGNYIVSFLHAEKKWLWGKRLKVFLHFEIISPEAFAGVRLFMAANVPQKNNWRVGYKFFRAWTMASGRRPKRRDRLSTKVFRNKYFIARVKVVEKTAKGTMRSEAAKYSLIDELLEVEAGGTCS